jgi:restriction system protein
VDISAWGLLVLVVFLLVLAYLHVRSDPVLRRLFLRINVGRSSYVTQAQENSSTYSDEDLARVKEISRRINRVRTKPFLSEADLDDARKVLNAALEDAAGLIKQSEIDFVASEFERDIQLRAALVAAVSKHLSTLRVKLSKAVKRNDYGVILTDTRNDVILDFLRSASPKFFSAVSTEAQGRIGPTEAIAYCGRVIDALSEKSSQNGFDPENYPQNGHDYEHWVAVSLRQFGWTAEVTRGSGDQGADIVASYNGVKTVFQCKRFKGSVGNAAVQEIVAARQHYGAARAVVISTGKFTASAKDLASSNNVFLISNYDIPKISEMLAVAIAAPVVKSSLILPSYKI